jgi:hypothetical protein
MGKRQNTNYSEKALIRQEEQWTHKIRKQPHLTKFYSYFFISFSI